MTRTKYCEIKSPVIIIEKTQNKTKTHNVHEFSKTVRITGMWVAVHD